MAKGVEGLAGVVAVGAVLHGVIREGGEVGGGAVDGDGEASGGVGFAEEDVRDGGAAVLAGIPDLQDGGDVRGCPGDRHRAATAIDEDDRFSGGMEFLEELFLHFREFNAGAVASVESFVGVFGLAFLAFEGGVDAAGKDDEVGGAGGGEGSGGVGGLGGVAFVFLEDAGAAAFVEDFDAGGGGEFFDAFEYRDLVGGLALVVAEEHAEGFGHGADDGDAFVFGGVEGEEVVFVF